MILVAAPANDTSHKHNNKDLQESPSVTLTRHGVNTRYITPPEVHQFSTASDEAGSSKVIGLCCDDIEIVINENVTLD